MLGAGVSLENEGIFTAETTITRRPTAASVPNARHCPEGKSAFAPLLGCMAVAAMVLVSAVLDVTGLEIEGVATEELTAADLAVVEVVIAGEIFLDETNRSPAGGSVGRTVSTTPRMLLRGIGSFGVTTAERDNFLIKR